MESQNARPTPEPNNVTLLELQRRTRPISECLSKITTSCQTFSPRLLGSDEFRQELSDIATHSHSSVRELVETARQVLLEKDLVKDRLTRETIFSCPMHVGSLFCELLEALQQVAFLAFLYLLFYVFVLVCSCWFRIFDSLQSSAELDSVYFE